MQIAVAGVSGMIGQKLLSTARSQGHQVIGVGRNKGSAYFDKFLQIDLTRRCIPIADLSGTDAYIHLAASFYGARKEAIEDTLTMTQNAVRSATQANVGVVVLVSSLAVIDYRRVGIAVNDHSPASDNCADLGNYAAVKLCQEQWFRKECERSKTRGVIIRPGLVYSESEVSRAHAGPKFGKFYIDVLHTGSVPVVSISNTVAAILKGCGIHHEAGEPTVLNVVDDVLPSQTQYISATRSTLTGDRRHIEISSVSYGKLVGCLDKLASSVGLAQNVPDSLRLSSYLARFRPLEFDFAVSRSILNLDLPPLGVFQDPQS